MRPRTRSGSPSPTRLKLSRRTAAKWLKRSGGSCAFQSAKLSQATEASGNDGMCSLISSSRSASGNGSGRRSEKLITLNSTVFAPMPSASASAAMAVKAGALRRERMP